MVSRNDITGDNLVSKPSNEKFDTGWELIWGNKEKEEDPIEDEVEDDVGC